jgi:hypothetical protein
VARRRHSFGRSVFVNCPFDADYLRLLRPLLFTIIYLRYTPRIASERSDSGENRIDKICSLIRECQYSIHDLSRLRAGGIGEISRMNMPFELGIEHGCRVFGSAPLNTKQCLVLEKDQHEFRKAISDLSGIDIKQHNNEPAEMVRAVRDWFVETVGLRRVQSPTRIWYRFMNFTSVFYDARLADGFTDNDLNMMPIPEYIDSIAAWLAESRHAASAPKHRAR